MSRGERTWDGRSRLPNVPRQLSYARTIRSGLFVEAARNVGAGVDAQHRPTRLAAARSWRCSEAVDHLHCGAAEGADDYRGQAQRTEARAAGDNDDRASCYRGGE
jgi:hypothetical protein